MATKTIHFGFVTISTINSDKYICKNNGNKRPGIIFKMTLNVLKWSELPPPMVPDLKSAGQCHLSPVPDMFWHH
jgi:hypothetical protein